MRKRLLIFGAAVFAALFLFSCVMILDYERQVTSAADEFESLKELIVANEIIAAEDDEVPALTAADKYRHLYELNGDFVGWISIEGTALDYPVMQTKSNPDYYLKHNFEKAYSNYGVPYVDERCALDVSNNIIIYGHHMKNNSMFSNLTSYAEKSFYDRHPIIRFDTLAGFGEYEVAYAFSLDVYEDDFKYSDYIDMSDSELAGFIANCESLQYYDTGISIENGDQLITLSTCEYTHKNGRFVVVARKL